MVAAVMAAVRAYLEDDEDDAAPALGEAPPASLSWRMAAWLPSVDPWAARRRTWTGRG